MARKVEGNSTDEIEITPAMMLAGLEAFTEYDRRFEDPEDAVARIYEEMVKAKSKLP